MRSDHIQRLYERRTSSLWRYRICRLLRPPNFFIMNSSEDIRAPLGRWNLYIGGAGSFVRGYINVDLFGLPGVDVIADAQRLPFTGDLFQRVECDAVLEHVGCPEEVVREVERVLAPGGFAHIVTPFCHPYHECPEDFRRFTLDGLKQMAGGLDVVAKGWRTGPTATMLVFLLEYVKLWLPWRGWRVLAHGILGWLLFPLRYLDHLFLKSSRAGRIGNHCYVWLRKPGPASPQQ